MTSCTRETIETVIARHGGTLSRGAHPYTAAGPCCVLEARSECLGIAWTDNPDALGIVDVRPLNDGPWSSAAIRTREMVRLVAAYDGWQTWGTKRQRVTVERIVRRTIQRIIADLPGLPPALCRQCRAAQTMDQAYAAALAVRTGTGTGTGTAAAAAAWAAEQAAWAAKATVLATAAAARAAALATAAAARAAAAKAKAAKAAKAKAADDILTAACQIWCEAAVQSS